MNALQPISQPSANRPKISRSLRRFGLALAALLSIGVMSAPALADHHHNNGYFSFGLSAPGPYYPPGYYAPPGYYYPPPPPRYYYPQPYYYQPGPSFNLVVPFGSHH